MLYLLSYDVRKQSSSDHVSSSWKATQSYSDGPEYVIFNGVEAVLVLVLVLSHKGSALFFFVNQSHT